MFPRGEAMPLDLASLRDAVGATETAVARSQDPLFMNGLDEVGRQLVRSGVIQHFEFTYELCWKFIQRWMTTNRPDGEALLPRTRKDLFRSAARYGLISDPEQWFVFGDARNVTAQAYDRSKADLVYAIAVTFAPEARKFLISLEKLNG
jgi:nucleotidyltransferase substrate binding protein (TIGR01987 family)